jgi:ferredoxin--NADP+ reductase
MPGPIEQLRLCYYNGTLIRVHDVHERLRIVRVQPDRAFPHFEPGQFAVLGMGAWESRSDGIGSGGSEASPRLIRRAYSISCPLLNSEGRLVTCEQCDFLEFYIALVNRPSDSPPALTPRLFSASEGDRLFVGPKQGGDYTLSGVRATDSVLFVATGTGEAPHNAMLARLLADGHRGRVVAITSVRYRRDLAYRCEHRELEKQFANYHYYCLITRENAIASTDAAREVCGTRVQEFLASGMFERLEGIGIDPAKWHVFLCGAPQMIGLPRKDSAGGWQFPEEPGMAELLVHRGFALAGRGGGNIHFEKYW